MLLPEEPCEIQSDGDSRVFFCATRPRIIVRQLKRRRAEERESEGEVEEREEPGRNEGKDEDEDEEEEKCVVGT